MLESLGLRRGAGARTSADLILFNTCSIREKADERFIAHLRQAAALKRQARPGRRRSASAAAGRSRSRTRCSAQFPFVDVAFGPGQVHKLAEFLTSDSLTAQGFFEFEGFTGDLPMRRARDFQAWMQISVGCNCSCSYCIVPSTRGREVVRPFDELVAEAARLAGDGVREVTLLGQNVNSYGRDLRPDRRSFAELLHAIDAIRDRARPLHVAAPEGHARGRHPRARRAAQPCASTSTCRCSRARRRSSRRCAARTPSERYLDRVALIREHVPDVRADDRHHRRLPGRDRGGLRADARGRRAGRLRRRVHLHLLAAARDRGGASHRPVRAARGRGRADGAARRGRPAPRARARAAVRRPHARRARRGPVAQRPDAAARPHAPQQGRELHRARRAGRDRRRSRSSAATSQTLAGSESLLARAAG